MSCKPPQILNTAGRIAKLLKQPMGRIQYVIRRKKVEPVSMAGRVKVFDNAQVGWIQHHCNLMGKVKRRMRRAKKGVRV